MKIIKGFGIGLQGYSKAITFITENKLWKYFLVPLILNVLLFALGVNYTSSLAEWATGEINQWWAQDSWSFFGAQFLISVLNFALYSVIFIFLFLAFSFMGGYIILIILTPLLTYLSEHVDAILRGEQYKFSWKQFLKDASRGLRITLRNFLMELFFVVALFIMSFIPVVGLFSTPLLFLISSYYYGASFMDFTFERKKLSVTESIRYTRQNKSLTVACGAPFALIMMVPFLGVKLASFVSVISTISSTIALYDQETQG